MTERKPILAPAEMTDDVIYFIRQLMSVLLFYNKKQFPAYTRAIFKCVVRKAYNLLTVITSSIANSPK